jgi:cobalt-zinc-cadmium efflux system protein
VGRWPSDNWRTFGYHRAETIGALVNLTALVMISLYLTYEAVHRLFNPQSIDGGIVMIVAGVALAVDVATAAMLLAISRGNLNLRAAFLHNVGDALSSVGVILAGAAALWFQAAWVDVAVTLVIASVVLWQCLPLVARATRVLLQSVPSDINLEDLIADLRAIDGVIGVHHVHVWEMDEVHRSLEAHIVVDEDRVTEWGDIKNRVRTRLRDRYEIQHSTLELETTQEAGCDVCPHTMSQ